MKFQLGESFFVDFSLGICAICESYGLFVESSDFLLRGVITSGLKDNFIMSAIAAIVHDLDLTSQGQDRIVTRTRKF